MNVKNFLIAGIVGGIVDFLLGWLFYGFLFKDAFATGEGENMTFIFLGCMSVGLFVSYIFTKWASISTPATGLKGGAVIGVFMGLYSNLFFNATNPTPDYKLMGLDMAIMIVMLAVVGAAVAAVNGKMK